LYFRLAALLFESDAAGRQIMKVRYGHSVTIDMPSELAVVLHELA